MNRLHSATSHAECHPGATSSHDQGFSLVEGGTPRRLDFSHLSRSSRSAAMGGPTIGPMNPMPTEHPQPPPPADIATSDEQIQQTAEEILDTGVRPIIADDYDARAVKFGEEIANLPPEDRARLIQELLRQDPGALHSWLEMRSEEHTSELQSLMRI